MSINPYTKWLGIPAAQQPPTLYRLVGVPDFETDTDKIHKRALEQIAKVRKYQTGQHSDLTQQLMNEISQARVCLLDPKRKFDYDMKLTAAAEVKEGNLTAPATNPSWVAAAITIAMMAVLVVGLFIFRGGDKSNADSNAPTENSETAPPPEKIEVALPPVKPPPMPTDRLAQSPLLDKLQVLYETGFGNQFARQGICLVGYAQEEIPTDNGHGLLLSLGGGLQRGLYMPVPKGDFRILVSLRGLSTKMPGHKIRLRACRDREQSVGICLEHPNPARTTAEGNSTPATATNAVPAKPEIPGLPGATASDRWAVWEGLGVPNPVKAAPFQVGMACWLDVRRLGKSWSVHVSNDGELFESVGTGTGDWDPVLLAFEVAVDAPVSLRCVLNYLRVEGTDDSYRERLATWPTQVPMPNSIALREMFSGKISLHANSLDLLLYDLNQPEYAKAWGAKLLEDGTPGALVPPATKMELGPIERILGVEANLAFPGSDAVLEFWYSDGGKIRLNASRGQIVANSADPNIKATANFGFTPDFNYRLRVVRFPSGKMAISLNNNPVLELTGPGFSGFVSVRTAGTDPITLRTFRAEGHLDFLTLWQGQLRGDPNNPLVKYERLPSEVQVTRVEAPPPSPAYKMSRVAPQPPAPMTLERGKPVNLDFINTQDDETEPWLEENGLTLHFTRQVGKESKLLVATRKEKATHFSWEGFLLGLPREGRQSSISLTPDGRGAMFCSDHEGKSKIYEATRINTNEPFGKIVDVEAFWSKGELAAPLLSPNGKQVFFGVSYDNRRGLFRAEREFITEGFGDPNMVQLEAVPVRATVTENGKNMVFEAMNGLGHHALYTSTWIPARKTWTVPILLSSISKPGTYNDHAPYVSADGKTLYFASDRPGGKGGLDLWAVALDSLPRAAAKTSKATGKTKATAKTSAKMLDGPILDWLILGPIDRQKLTGGEPGDILRGLHRDAKLTAKNPAEGDKALDLTWERTDQLDLQPGIYLLATTLQVKSQFGRVLLSDAPGATIVFDSGKELLAHQLDKPWETAAGANQHSKSIRWSGRRRLTVVVCVTDETAPLNIQLVGPTEDTPLKDISLVGVEE